MQSNELQFAEDVCTRFLEQLKNRGGTKSVESSVNVPQVNRRRGIEEKDKLKWLDIRSDNRSKTLTLIGQAERNRQTERRKTHQTHLREQQQAKTDLTRLKGEIQ